ncbi:MAG: hemerythrin domain-containing protein [Verrucomicrobia bacterium]|nr:hemerythrin domain-containing protein [Verrucomicrobiota bacterium]
MNITEALVAEHTVLLQLFDHVESELLGIASLESLQLLARIIERLLHSHGEAEEDLVLCALDHSLEDQGRRERFHQEHQELDERFKQLQTATDLETARRLFYGALQASRKHFRFEEESLFPFASRVLGKDILLELGQFRALAQAEIESDGITR